MVFWQRKRDRPTEQREMQDPILTALLGRTEVTRVEAMNIPAVAACVKLIAETTASVPIKLFKENGEEVKELLDDERIFLFNDETGDLLNGAQMKEAWVTDYLLDGNGYIHIARDSNRINKFCYVPSDRVSVTYNSNPLDKKAEIFVFDKKFYDFDFVIITQNSEWGLTGKGVIKQQNKQLSVMYNTLKFEEALVKTGGNKKGFLKSQNRVAKDTIDDLKIAWKRMYGNNEENIVVLNNGLEFQEASNTSVEMQLNENKKSNANEICKLFSVPPSMLNGTASDVDRQNFIQNAIMPILNKICIALNKSALLESEKEQKYYYAPDLKALNNGDILRRYQAYEIALNNNFMQLDEVRYELDLKPLGFNYIKLGLDDVLLNPDTNEIYTPNTKEYTRLNGVKNGGEKA